MKEDLDAIEERENRRGRQVARVLWLVLAFLLGWGFLYAMKHLLGGLLYALK